jgi:hypothetical protein
MVACRQYFVEFNTILIDITNFGEQVLVLILYKMANISNEEERRLFFVLFGISCASILNSLTVSKRKQILLSFLIEIAEFGGYVTIFHLFDPNIVGKTMAFAMGIGTLSCLALQLVLHFVNIIIIGRTDKKASPCQRILSLLINLFTFIIINLSVFLVLFLRSDSRFHSTYFEILTAASFFISSLFNGVRDDANWSTIATITSEIPLEEMSNIFKKYNYLSVLKEQLEEKYTKIYRYWFYLIMLFSYIILLPVTSVSTIVFASEELRLSMLPSYDKGILIVSLVGSSITTLFYLLIVLGGLISYCRCH